MGLLNTLIQQAKQPRGLIGAAMLKIMNSVHIQLTAWGLLNVEISDTATVLDIGCGGGQTIKTLSKKVKHGKIYGVDYSQKSVLTSSKKNNKDVKSGKVIVKQASVSSMPFSDNFFDVITAYQTHYFWPDLKNDMKEVNRILKTGGQFLLVGEIYKVNYHMKEYKTSDDLRALLLASGFCDVAVYESKSAICLVGIK